jgi:hypothetical protein
MGWPPGANDAPAIRSGVFVREARACIQGLQDAEHVEDGELACGFYLPDRALAVVFSPGHHRWSAECLDPNFTPLHPGRCELLLVDRAVLVGAGLDGSSG